MFFGPKLNTVFASRWKAAIWSACVLMTAYCSLPAADQAQQNAVHKVEKASAAQKSPWAIDSK